MREALILRFSIIANFGVSGSFSCSKKAMRGNDAIFMARIGLPLARRLTRKRKPTMQYACAGTAAALFASLRGWSYLEAGKAGTSDGKKRVGYYVWSRFGFEGDPPESVKPPSPDKRKSSMHTKNGRNGWQDQGETFDLEFIPEKNGSDMKRLRGYLREKRYPP
jgi:hypothetical protein